MRRTASLRLLASFRLIHLPHHVQPITAASARTTPAAVPLAIAATGIFDWMTAPVAVVGTGPAPPEVNVVVTNVGEAVTSTVTKTVDVVEAEREGGAREEAEVEAAGVIGAMGYWIKSGAEKQKAKPRGEG